MERSKTNISSWFWGGLLVAGLVWYGTFRVAGPLSHSPFSPGFHGNDFKHIYLGSWMLPRGMDPYDASTLKDAARRRGFGNVNPYVYLPFAGLVLSPLALLDPPDAMRTWFVLNHLFLAGAFALMFWSLRLKPDLRNLAVAVGVVALCFPLHRTLTAGQLNCALLFLYALVFALHRRGLPMLAGAVAAFAFLFKLAPGILLVYFGWSAFRNFLRREKTNSSSSAKSPFRSNVKATLSMCVFSALLMGGAILWVGVERHLAFRPLLEQMGYGKSTWAEFGEQFHRDPANQSFNSFFHHILTLDPRAVTTPWVDLGARWANALTRLALVFCGGLFLWRTWPRRKLEEGKSALSSDDDMVYALVILLSLLTPGIYWDHYVVIALWPLIASYARLPARLRGEAFLLFLCLTFPLGAFRDLGVLGTGAFAAGALAVAGRQLYLRRPGSVLAVAWALAAALMTARFLFSAPANQNGPGLLAMSLALWGTLVLFGLCLCMMGGRERKG